MQHSRRLSYNDTVSDAFGRHADTYDQNSEIQKYVADRLSVACPDESDVSRILEIGCGTGHLTRNLRKKYPGAKLVITDINSDMLVTCREKNGADASIEYHIMNGEDVDSSLGQFDLIVSSMAVQWFQSPKKSIGLWSRSLVSGGSVFLSTLADGYFEEWRDALKTALCPSRLICPPELPDGMLTSVFAKKENYGSARGFLKHLKETGASTSGKGMSALNPGEVRAVMKAYDKKYQGEMTWKLAIGKWQP